MDAIRERQWTASGDGRSLAGALVELIQSFIPVGALKGAPVALVRDLAGDHCGDLLGLPPADWTRLLIEAAEVADPLVNAELRLLGLTRIYGLTRQAIMHGVAKVEREGKAVKFRIPESLKRSLGST